MKKTNSLLFLIALIAMSACSKKNIGYFQNSYEPVVTAKKEISNSEEIKKIISQNNNEDELISASIDQVQIPHINVEKPWNRVENKSILEHTSLDSKEVIEPKKISREDRQHLKQTIKKIARHESNQKTNRSFIGGLLLVILAIILPPLAVLLVDGLSGPFWLSILLTILFWVPGVIYALYRIFKDR